MFMNIQITAALVHVSGWVGKGHKGSQCPPPQKKSENSSSYNEHACVQLLNDLDTHTR